MSDAAMASMLDEWAIRKLSMEYAAAADRGDGPGFAAVFAADAVIEGPGFKVEGLEYIAGNPGMLKQMYASTMHTVMNQTVTITGDTAAGERLAASTMQVRSTAAGRLACGSVSPMRDRCHGSCPMLNATCRKSPADSNGPGPIRPSTRPTTRGSGRRRRPRETRRYEKRPLPEREG